MKQLVISYCPGAVAAIDIEPKVRGRYGRSKAIVNSDVSLRKKTSTCLQVRRKQGVGLQPPHSE